MGDGPCHCDPCLLCPTPPVTPPPLSAPSTPIAQQLTCDFERGTCGWKDTAPWTTRTSSYPWTRTSGGTPSIFTGPSGDHTTGSGYYLYTEASGIHSKVHRLESPHFSLQQDATLSFYYHMHDDTGLNMGTLSVEAFERANGWLTLWSQSGHQADSWLHKTVVLPASTIQVRFSGLTGPGFSSDMALDDVSFGQFEPRPVTVSITQSNWFQIGIASRNFARDGDTSTSCPEDSCTTESTTAEFAMFYNHRDNRHNGRLVEGNGIQGQNRVNWGDLPANGARDITVTADCTAKTVTISSDGQSFTGSYPSSWSSVYVAVGAQGGPFSATLPSGNTWLGGSSTQTLSGGFRGNRGEQDLCASSGSASEQNSYSTTTGFCRGGSSWPDGNEYNCFEDVARTRIQMTDAECRQECDANVECAAYDRSWYDRQGILIEDIPTGAADCCLFKAGSTGNGDESFVCMLKPTSLSPPPPPWRPGTSTPSPASPEPSPPPPPEPSPPNQATCQDTPGWGNGFDMTCSNRPANECNVGAGLTCYHYSLSPNPYCANGVVVPGREFSQGAGFNFPESNCCACGKAATEPSPTSLSPPPPPPPTQATCQDTPGWGNGIDMTCSNRPANECNVGAGLTCYHYSLSYCANGVVVPGREFSQGAGFNFPESNCCACGKAFRIVARSPAAA